MAQEKLNIVKDVVFDHPQFGHLRTMSDDKGNPWFVGKVVAEALGYKNSRKAIIDHVDPEDKTTVTIRDTGSNYKTQAVVINESGLYSLTLASKLPQAREFKHWVTSVVLPSVRQNGGYIVSIPGMSNEEILARGYELAMKTIEEKNHQLSEQAPMVNFANAVIGSKGNIYIGEMAKLLAQNGCEIGPARLFRLMRQQGYLYRRGRSTPTQEWVEKGILEVVVKHCAKSRHAYTVTMVTPQGQKHFVDMFLPAA